MCRCLPTGGAFVLFACPLLRGRPWPLGHPLFAKPVFGVRFGSLRTALAFRGDSAALANVRIAVARPTLATPEAMFLGFLSRSPANSFVARFYQQHLSLVFLHVADEAMSLTAVRGKKKANHTRCASRFY